MISIDSVNRHRSAILVQDTSVFAQVFGLGGAVADEGGLTSDGRLKAGL